MEERTLQSLLRPEAYEDFPSEVCLKQTHVSYIFITVRYVYKIKKPVDFGFLNFTTLDRRRFYCEEEVRLNRRLSPDVYLGVSELRETSDGASFTADGPVVDYAVKMRRLPDEKMLDRLVDEGSIDASDIMRLASTVADFHLAADRGGEIRGFGSIDAIRQNWSENFSMLSSHIGSSLSAESFEMLRNWVDSFMSANTELFEQRMENGFIRDCDGDLHLANICLGEDVWIFDCIEFNARFRYIDTSSDIAFLLMDLDYHGRADLAAVFLNEYCRLTGDTGAVRLIDFYKIYRAFVRGKIACLKMLDSGISKPERDAALEASIKYFRLASGYLLRKSLPNSMIMIGGMPGSGKSTLANQLGIELGLKVLSSDRLRKELFPPEPALESVDSKDLYSENADAVTYSELCRQATALVKNGESVVVDATFRRRSDRDIFMAGASSAGAVVCLAVATASEEIIIQRLEERRLKPDRYSDAGVEVYRLIANSFEWPDPATEQFILLQTSLPAGACIDAILKALGVIR